MHKSGHSILMFAIRYTVTCIMSVYSVTIKGNWLYC